MKVVLIGATGNIGSKVAAEQVSRGISVTTIAECRQEAGLDECPGKERRRYRRFARWSRCGREFCTFTPGLSPAIIEAVRRSDVKRYIMVGGAGSLEVAPARCSRTR
jgi:putative NADH-flavin reductase